MIDDEIRALTVPKKLKPYIGDYYTALVRRAESGMLGDSEFKCFKRFLALSEKYEFAEKSMDFMFRFLDLLVFIDDDGKPQHLRLYPVQKFIMCAIFGLRRPDGRYLVNTANIYMARRNGKSFLLSGVLHYLMAMSKFKSEKIILASCKGQNATICFDEFVNFIDNDPFLRDSYDNVNRTACWARNKLTNNKLEMFRTGAGAKKTLDGFTNRVAIIDEEMLCDKIITKTIQDGQAHYKDRLLVTMSTAQFSIGSENHKKWLNLRAALYDDVLPDETFLFLCEPNKRDVEKGEYTSIKVWGKANPVLLFEKDGYTVKDHIKRTYGAEAKSAMRQKGFELQNFATKQCNVWYCADDRSLCTPDEMKACEVDYSFEDVVKAGYKTWYVGMDMSQSLDLTSIYLCTYYGVAEDGSIIPAGEVPDHYRLFSHWISWLPKNKLQKHIEADHFPYFDYVGKELYLCTGGGGDTIDSNDPYEKLVELREKHGISYVTIAADPYGIAGVQGKLEDLCDTFILQNQSPKALSQYLEVLSGLWKAGTIAYQKGHEDIMEKAMTNAVMLRNQSGFYSVEKMSLRADSNIRIDPVDAMVTGFIAAYIDHENGAVNGDEAVANWLGMMGGVME